MRRDRIRNSIPGFFFVVSGGMRKAEVELQRKRAVETMAVFPGRLLDVARKTRTDPREADPRGGSGRLRNLAGLVRVHAFSKLREHFVHVIDIGCFRRKGGV